MSQIARWTFNESSGLLLTDSVGSNNGSLTNMVGDEWSPGKWDNALSYDGVDDHVVLGDIFNFERDEAFSISLWVKAPANTTTRMIFAKTSNANPKTGYQIFFHTDNVIRVALISSTTTGNYMQIRAATTVVADNTWRHVVVTYDGSSNASGLKVYIDSLDKSIIMFDALTASIVSSTPLQINGRQGANLNHTGLTDEIRVFDEVISNDTIQNLFNYNSITAPGGADMGIGRVQSKSIGLSLSK